MGKNRAEEGELKVQVELCVKAGCIFKYGGYGGTCGR